MPPNSHPEILGEDGEWAQVRYNGIVGWAHRQYLAYDKGGIMRGKGVALKDTLLPEAVLSPEQTRAWVRLVDNLTNPVLARLSRTPATARKDNLLSQSISGDTFEFHNITIRANDIQEFITSIRGQVPIRNK